MREKERIKKKKNERKKTTEREQISLFFVFVLINFVLI